MGSEMCIRDRAEGGRKLHTVSALTLLGLGEMSAHRGSYVDLLRTLEASGAPLSTGEEMFRRIAVNIAVGNNDDHARNHAAFWDGRTLELAPAFDIDPRRSPLSYATKQALAYGPSDGIGGGDRAAEFASLLPHARLYGISPGTGADIVSDVISTINANWNDACDVARLSQTERDALWERVILAPQTTDSLSAQISVPWRP